MWGQEQEENSLKEKKTMHSHNLMDLTVFWKIYDNIDIKQKLWLWEALASSSPS